MSDQLLLQIEKISMIKHNRDLFRTLCGLDLGIYRLDGTPINIATTKNVKTPNSGSESTSNNCSCINPTNNCDRIDRVVINTVVDTKKPQTYICRGSLKKIVVPIILNEEVVGLLFTGENNSYRFQEDQCHTVTQILLQFMNYIVKNELTPLNINIYEGNSITRQRELLNRAVKYIKSNFHSTDLTLKDVSNNNGVSYHHLSRIFKKELNTTFAQFRNKVRLEAATKMLKNRRLSVSQISYSCGFDDPAYFSKVFRDAFGTTPMNYRNNYLPKSRIRSKLKAIK